MQQTGTALNAHLARLPGFLRRLRNGETADAVIPELLHSITEVCGAERAIVVELEGGTSRTPWSSTIDGDAVPEAVDRVPAALIRTAAACDGDMFQEPSDGMPQALRTQFEDLGRKGARLYRLAGPAGRGTFLYLENRFCPLADAKDAHLVSMLLVEALRLAVWVNELRNDLERHEAQLAKAESLLTQMRAPEDLARAGVSGAPAPLPRRRSLAFKGDYSRIVTCSPRMYAIFSVLDRIAHTSATVLIMGESGTGKELIASAIHANSPRAASAFIPENCAALTETLLESELFGYKKGAFTGAAADRKGLFELADRGTLLLDEVGDMSMNMQKKLLRVLQEGILRPVGGKEFVSVDVRVISATNRDLSLAVQEGAFREDLFYRLNVITIDLPPLRERTEDIPLLTAHFLDQFAGHGTQAKRVSAQAAALMQAYRWPGNIRELQNEVQRIHALSGDIIEVDDLSDRIRECAHAHPAFSMDDLQILPLKQAIDSFEREFLRRALSRYAGNRSKIAQALGVPKTSLYNKLQKHNLMRT